jgi:catechol 2,3-dioxygenase-like lactoylglutathione lyase family enzyme
MTELRIKKVSPAASPIADALRHDAAVQAAADAHAQVDALVPRAPGLKQASPASPSGLAEPHVTGIGGIFFYAKDPAKTRAWYAEKLGVDVHGEFWDFKWRERESPELIGHTVWKPFDPKSKHFSPGTQPYMLNLRVNDLEGVLARLKAQGVKQIGKTVSDFTGSYAHVRGPDGVKLELWQPAERRESLPPGR